MAKLKGLFDHEDSSGHERKAGKVYDEPDESVVMMRLRSGVCVRIHESGGSHATTKTETKTMTTTDTAPAEVKVLPDESNPIPDIGMTEEAPHGRS